MKSPPRQGPLPFWIHQTAEYGLAMVLASSAVRLPNPALPIGAAIVVLLVAASADGPLAAAHIVKRPLHRTVDLVVGVLMVLVAGALFRQVGSSASILTGLSGVAMLGLSWRTNYAPKPARAPRRLPSGVLGAQAVFRARKAVWSSSAAVPPPEVVSSPNAEPLAPPDPTTLPITMAAPTSAASTPGAESLAEPPSDESPKGHPSASPVPPLSRGAKAEKVGRKAGRYAAVGVKVWKNRKQ